MYYNLTWMHGSKELACTVKHDVLKEYSSHSEIWAQKKTNKQINI